MGAVLAETSLLSVVFAKIKENRGIKSREMGKPRAPLPPTPAASRLRTPMKPTVTRKNSAPNLSVVAAYDDLMRNSAIFHNGAEEKFLAFVKIAKNMRRKWEHAETERQRLNIEINTMEKQ